jgi:hypothetical protein
MRRRFDPEQESDRARDQVRRQMRREPRPSGWYARTGVDFAAAWARASGEHPPEIRT